MQTFDQAIRELSEEIASLVISKQRDYGTKNILNCPITPEIGILVRLHDKMARISNLLQTKQNPNNESLEDSWKDVCGYALIALLVMRNQFTLPLEEDAN